VLLLILIFLAVIVSGSWLRPKPEPNTTVKTEQIHTPEIIDITPLEAAAADALRGSAARLSALQAEITRLRDDLADLDGEARKIDNGIVKSILMKHLDRNGARDFAQRHASVALLNREANRLLSGAGPSQPTALLLGDALAEERAARRLVEQLIADLAYVRRQVELKNETARRNRP
jgi:hypothetical protein